MKKFQKQLLTMSLISLLNSAVSGCSFQGLSSDDIVVGNVLTMEDEFTNDIDKRVALNMESSLSSIEEPLINEDIIVTDIPIVIANKKTPIINTEDNKTVLGYLPASSSLIVKEKSDNGYVIVEYFKYTAKVREKDVTYAYACDIKSPIKKVLYATSDTTLTIPDYLSESKEEEEVPINKLECLEVYNEFNDYYLVKTQDYIGYVAKTNVKELEGTFVVVDISDQILKLYENNEVILESPVVTGTPTKSRETDIGLWEIYDISHNRALNGAGYSSPIDVMMKFNGGEGLHDAEYHSCDFWKKHGKKRHGWRSVQEFGGDTYLTNGSHGCVNMLHDDVFEVEKHVSIGTKVLVKP